jgi:hypothetical protein
MDEKILRFITDWNTNADAKSLVHRQQSTEKDEALGPRETEATRPALQVSQRTLTRNPLEGHVAMMR